MLIAVILIDSSPPKISNCPGNIDINVPDNADKVEVNWEEPTATTGNHPLTIIEEAKSPGSYFSIGTTPINYMFIDSLSFKSSCSFLISGKTIRLTVYLQGNEKSSASPTTGLWIFNVLKLLY